MYRSLFPSELFAELDRLQREVQGAFDFSPSIRGLGRGGYPALNVGGTPSSVEIYAFAPGLDPAAIDINLDRGVLSIAGERKGPEPARDEKTTMHIDERFAGRFRRVVSPGLGGESEREAQRNARDPSGDPFLAPTPQARPLAAAPPGRTDRQPETSPAIIGKIR